MTPAGNQPSPGPWPVDLPVPGKPNPLPNPAPLGPIVTPLPQSSTVAYIFVKATGVSTHFAVLAHAPVGSILRYIHYDGHDAITPDLSGWAIRAHSNLPATVAQFTSGHLVFPTSIYNPDLPDWVTPPRISNQVHVPCNIVLPHSAPLLVFALHNASALSVTAAVWAVIDPPAEIPV